MEELETERHLAPLSLVVIGGALFLPAGLLRRLVPTPDRAPDWASTPKEWARIEGLARPLYWPPRG